MRGYYLHTRHDNDHGMRGGVGHGYDTGFSNEYELEIGNNANASPELIALCCLHDEILEFLAVTPSLLGDALLAMYHKEVEKIEMGFEKNRQARKEKYNE